MSVSLWWAVRSHRSGSDFVSVEALGGVVLLGATFAALAWANIAGVSYADVWSHDLTIGWGRFAISKTCSIGSTTG